MPDEIIITDLTDDSLATTIAEVPQLVEVVPVGSDQELSSLPLAKRAAEERPLQDGHPEAAAELGDSSSSSSSTIMVPSSLGSVDENISASRTLTNRKQSASLFPNINFPINDTTSAALPATNTSAATTAPPPLPNPLSCNSAQILLMQLMLQWKENKAHIDDLMRKSQDLSRIIQDSIEPNEAVVKVSIDLVFPVTPVTRPSELIITISTLSIARCEKKKRKTKCCSCLYANTRAH